MHRGNLVCFYVNIHLGKGSILIYPHIINALSFIPFIKYYYVSLNVRPWCSVYTSYNNKSHPFISIFTVMHSIKSSITAVIYPSGLHLNYWTHTEPGPPPLLSVNIISLISLNMEIYTFLLI